MRRIDMVLAFQDVIQEDEEEEHEKIREIFQKNLERGGLQLEIEHKATSFDRKTHFIKIHAPHSLLERFSEIHDMKHPVKEYILTYYSASKGPTGMTVSCPERPYCVYIRAIGAQVSDCKRAG